MAPTKPARAFRSQRGQATIEAVLLVAAFVIATSMVANFSRNQGMLKAFVSGPWVQLQGMIENGVWEPAVQGRARHPNKSPRQQTVRGEGTET